MQDLSYWFYFKYYTECFCLAKKCIFHKNDSKQKPADIYTLTYADDMLRESAFIASMTSGIIITLLTAGTCGLAIKKNPMSPFTLGGVFVGIGIIWNLPKIQKKFSHFGIMFGLPIAFNIIEATSEKCISKKYIQEFLDEFKDEIPKYKKN
ncbi:hypothetical protein SteCoe_26340 [Stentor coeruleus]|uniref:Uncharacterized protein n=1 Tax=Stentor coeruleus TaxID=5963 RepID=A0A1R2BD57_9CILI|nr:hypothetical protein SteCoe_26340 [Stentor coeruleus]